MARRAELFVRELTDEEAAHLLKQARRGKNAVVRDRAMLLFASFQGQSVTQIATMFRASATHVAALIHDFNARGFPALDPCWGGGRPRRIDQVERTEIVKAALARPTDRGEPFTSWSLTKLQDYVVRAGIVPAISRSQLWRVLHEAGIRFTHHKTWKASPDPEFEAKKNRILDLYAHPPAGSRGCSALTSWARLNLEPRLGHGWQPMLATRPASGPPTSGPRGCATCSPPTTRRPAGCSVTSGRHQDLAGRSGSSWRTLRARFAEHLIVIFDNFSPHHKKELWAGCAERDIELVFTPTYSSWLNLILGASSRHSAPSPSTAPTIRGHVEQDAAIRAYLRLAQPEQARPAKPWRIKAEVQHHPLPQPCGMRHQ